MYQTHRDIKCSKCGALNHYRIDNKTVPDFLEILKTQTYFVCLGCGHSRLIQTVSAISTGKQIINAPPLNEPELF